MTEPCNLYLVTATDDNGDSLDLVVLAREATEALIEWKKHYDLTEEYEVLVPGTVPMAAAGYERIARVWRFKIGNHTVPGPVHWALDARAYVNIHSNYMKLIGCSLP